jgi:competence protein ComEA
MADERVVHAAFEIDRLWVVPSVGWRRAPKGHADDPGLKSKNARSACFDLRIQAVRDHQEDLIEMSIRRVLVTSVALALLSAPAFAQGAGMTKQAPSMTSAPAATAKPATTGAATAPVAAKTNLNTATAAELDKLPKLGPARSKAIVEARAKEKFKNWDDFVARKVVPSDAAAAIKDVVAF